MPQKTKKQKIIARYRRKYLTRVSHTIETSKEPKKQIVPVSPTLLPVVPASSVLNQNRSVITGDIRKTIMFSLIAIVLEFMIYFVTSS